MRIERKKTEEKKEMKGKYVRKGFNGWKERKKGVGRVEE